MPKAFLECIRKGGKIRTMKIDESHYMHVCWLNGKSYAGEIKKIKSKRRKK